MNLDSSLRQGDAGATPSDDGQLGVPRKRRKATTIAADRTSRLPVSLVALCAATGVLVLAAADTAERLGHAGSPWPGRAYWLGQALIVLPVAVRMLARRGPSEIGTAALVVVLTVAEYLVKICYSPVGFTYTDELEHWRSAVNLLHTGKLYTVNYLLPISPHYPGLEEAASALVSATGLPLFPCGLIVAGIAHLLCICLLYLLFRNIANSYRIAGIAVLFYSSNPDLPSFDSMFSYQTLAVAFLGLAMLAAWRLASADSVETRARWLTLAVLAVMATVITHHVTSYVLVAALVLVTIASLLTGHRRSAAWLAVLTLVSVAMVSGWAMFAAPGTVSYLEPAAVDVMHGLRAVSGGGHSTAPSLSAEPLVNRALAAGDVLLMSALVLVGLWHAWRRCRRQPWILAMAIGSLTWYAIVIVRLKIPDGSELSGRAATFVFVPAAFVVAIAVAHVVSLDLRWKASAVALGTILGTLIIMADGLANGWPPFWERLPGPYQVAGVDRSVEPQEITTARWALAALGPGNRFAADVGSYAVLGSYGDQNPVYGDAYLYTTPVYTQADARRVQAQAIGYILVDLRLSKSLPVSGSYFLGLDPGTGRYTHPLAVTGLTKFDHIPGVSRRYDSGNIIIYDLEGSEYYAP